MAQIDDFIAEILSAVYGEEVRSSIVGALRLCYSDVKANVEAVLKEHPEYTSTVQDGSINTAKLSQALQGRLNDIEEDYALKSKIIDGTIHAKYASNILPNFDNCDFRTKSIALMSAYPGGTTSVNSANVTNMPTYPGLNSCAWTIQYYKVTQTAFAVVAIPVLYNVSNKPLTPFLCDYDSSRPMPWSDWSQLSIKYCPGEVLWSGNVGTGTTITLLDGLKKYRIVSIHFYGVPNDVLIHTNFTVNGTIMGGFITSGSEYSFEGNYNATDNSIIFTAIANNKQITTISGLL